MPRDGTQTYILPFPDVVADTTIESPVYNGFTNDVAQDLNNPRPITSGGTGATSAAGALAALSGESAGQVVTNYDSYVFKAGSFYSAAGATAAPNAHAFIGICYLSDASNIVLEARDSSDGLLYVRRKVASVWGAWTLDTGDAATTLKVAKAGDTMTGPLELPVAAPTLGVHATNKTYVDAADATLTTSVDNRVRYDAAQGLSGPQQIQARSNIAGFGVVKIQKFTASGTYTPSAGLVYCIMECWGGGGGGGAVLGAAGVSQIGGGGGGGGYSRAVVSAGSVGASKPVVVGAGGTNPFGNGGAGGSSSVSSFLTANGGNGGAPTAFSVAGTIGASIGTGDLAVPGPNSPGAIGDNTATLAVAVGGSGASTAVGGGGGGGQSAGNAAAGVAATGYAAGGGGAACSKVTGSPLGGVGAPGLVVITEFCTQ